MNFEYRDLIYEYAMYLIDEGYADINEIDKLIEKKYHVKIDGYKFYVTKSKWRCNEQGT